VAKQLAPLIVIVGQTASGKSDLAILLAEKFNGEIICADSWTVYKEFDIGTAKPSLDDQSRVPHHLIDVADPQKGYSAAIFKRQATRAIEQIHANNRLPILVGGTGLYIDSVLYDYSFLPKSNPKIRDKLNSMSITELIQFATEKKLDLSKIDDRNKRRVIRLIENQGKLPTKTSLRPKTLVLGLKCELEMLRLKIDQRIDKMIALGFVDEVKSLGKKYGWDIEPMKAPGYRAFRDFIEGKISIQKAKDRFLSNDLQLAKKQRTWFKRNQQIVWISDYKEGLDHVEQFLNKEFLS